MIPPATSPRVPAARVPRIVGLASTVLAALFATILGLPVQAQSLSSSKTAPRITERLDERQRTILKGNTPPQAQAKYDQGAVADSTPADRMVLLFKRSDAQDAELRKLVEDQHNASSASYHQWLQPAELASRFGPADSDIEQVKAWLQAKGFAINSVSRGKVSIIFSGTAGQVRDAFKTELHTYKNGATTYHANSSDPQIPTAFAPVISGFASLNDIKPKANTVVKGTSTYDPKTHQAIPNWNAPLECGNFANGVFSIVECTYYPPTPGDLAVQYNINPVYKAGNTGKGVTIGVLSDSNVDLSVVQNYRTLFGFTNTANLPQVIVDGNDPGQNGDALEAYLDVEASAAMAPDATTNLYVSGDTLTTSGLISAIVRGVDDNAADVLTISYGACEQSLGLAGNQFFYQMWQQAAAQGQSVFVSAGDAGSAGCDNFNQEGQATLGLAVNGFASTPYNTAVGGTDFYYPAWAEGSKGADVASQLAAVWGSGNLSSNPVTSLIAPIQEQPWNDGYGQNILNGDLGYSIVAGSGGASSCVTGSGVDPNTGGYTTCAGGYPKPSWQVGKGVPADAVRDLPDVSLFASSGENFSFWPICAGVYDCLPALTAPGYAVTLTSVGGTSAASPAMAGIMALVDQTQKGRQGNANFQLYSIAAQYPNAFNDVTTGSNNVVCQQGTPDCSLDTNGDGYYTLQHYSATPGYDLASGLGSLNVANLIADWGKLTYKTTSTSITPGSSSVVHGAPLNVTAAVLSSGGTPTGAVALVTSSTTPGQAGVGTIQLTAGTGSAGITSLPGGTYTLKGEYGGDGVFGPSTSTAASITVTPEPSALTLSAADYNTSNYPPSTTTVPAGGSLPYDDVLILDASVASKSGNGTATGQVTFFDGKTNLGTFNVGVQGVAELQVGTLAPGLHNLSASYTGDVSFATSFAPPQALTVTQGVPNINVLYAAGYSNGQQTVFAGQPFVATAQVYGGNLSIPPTGNITVSFGAIGSQTVALSPGFAGVPVASGVVAFAPNTPGTYTLTATYAGDPNYAAGVDPYPQTITVVAPTLAVTATTLVANTTSLGPDGVITLTATVTGTAGGPTPTGSVGFILGPAEYGVQLNSQGVATVEIGADGFSTGPNTVYARYQGDKVYAQSTSTTIAVTANVGDFTLTATTSTLAVTSGSTGTTNLTIAQMIVNSVNGGLTGPVDFTCTPSSAEFTCSLSPATLNLAANGAQTSTTLTVNTHVPVKASNDAPSFPSPGKVGGGVVALAILLLAVPVRRRVKTKLLLLMMMAAVGAGAIGCGGHGSQPAPIVPPPTGNATPGTYNVSVLANAGGVQHSLVLTVTVQ